MIKKYQINLKNIIMIEIDADQLENLNEYDDMHQKKTLNFD